MLKGDNTATLIKEIAAAKEDGTDAFFFEIEIMKKECRTRSEITYDETAVKRQNGLVLEKYLSTSLFVVCLFEHHHHLFNV